MRGIVHLLLSWSAQFGAGYCIHRSEQTAAANQMLGFFHLLLSLGRHQQQVSQPIRWREEFFTCFSNWSAQFWARLWANKRLKIFYLLQWLVITIFLMRWILSLPAQKLWKRIMTVEHETDCCHWLFEWSMMRRQDCQVGTSGKLKPSHKKPQWILLKFYSWY